MLTATQAWRMWIVLLLLLLTQAGHSATATEQSSSTPHQEIKLHTKEVHPMTAPPNFALNKVWAKPVVVSRSILASSGLVRLGSVVDPSGYPIGVLRVALDSTATLLVYRSPSDVSTWWTRRFLPGATTEVGQSVLEPLPGTVKEDGLGFRGDPILVNYGSQFYLLNSSLTAPAAAREHWVFVVTTLRGQIMALDLRTGRTVWSYSYPQPSWAFSPSVGPCFTATPAASPWCVFVGLRQNALVVLDGRTGAQVHEIRTKAGVWASPTVVPACRDPVACFDPFPLQQDGAEGEQPGERETAGSVDVIFGVTADAMVERHTFPGVRKAEAPNAEFPGYLVDDGGPKTTNTPVPPFSANMPDPVKRYTLDIAPKAKYWKQRQGSWIFPQPLHLRREGSINGSSVDAFFFGAGDGTIRAVDRVTGNVTRAEKLGKGPIGSTGVFLVQHSLFCCIANGHHAESNFCCMETSPESVEPPQCTTIPSPGPQMIQGAPSVLHRHDDSRREESRPDTMDDTVIVATSSGKVYSIQAVLRRHGGGGGDSAKWGLKMSLLTELDHCVPQSTPALEFLGRGSQSVHTFRERTQLNHSTLKWIVAVGCTTGVVKAFEYTEVWEVSRALPETTLSPNADVEKVDSNRIPVLHRDRGTVESSNSGQKQRDGLANGSAGNAQNALSGLPFPEWLIGSVAFSLALVTLLKRLRRGR